MSPQSTYSTIITNFINNIKIINISHITAISTNITSFLPTLPTIDLQHQSLNLCRTGSDKIILCMTISNKNFKFVQDSIRQTDIINFFMHDSILQKYRTVSETNFQCACADIIQQNRNFMQDSIQHKFIIIILV